jgi:uncharacterized membrane protein (UPF0127 family)
MQDLNEKTFSLNNCSKDVTVVEKIYIADKFWSRTKGLLGRSSLECSEGLLLVPCNSVHCMFMRFPIDIIFLNRDFQVVKIYENFKPWCVTPIIRNAYQVLELKAGAAKDKCIETGDELALV